MGEKARHGKGPAGPAGDRRLVEEDGPAVLVRLPNWIGDAVMAAPAIFSLASALPHCEIGLIGRPSVLPLFEGCGEPFRLLPPLPKRGRGPVPWMRTIAYLRRREFAAALVLPPSFSAALMVLAAGIPVRVGWPTDGRRGLLTDASARPSRQRPLREQYAELAARLVAKLSLRPIGPLSPIANARLPLLPAELAEARAVWQEWGWRPERTLALAPGAQYGPTKRWPEEKFRVLLHVLREEGWNLLLIGGNEERELCARLAGDGLGGRARSLAGSRTLRQSLALLSGVRAVISNDSGAMHLAQAAGAPVLGIFGSTSPAWTGPAGPRAEVVYHALACSPCFSRTCPTRIECLGGIEPGEVRSALGRLLARTEVPAGRPAAFLDRDGTVLDLVPYLNRVEDVRLAPGAAGALRALRQAGFALVVVTNQSVVARGMLDRTGLQRIHRRMESLLREEGIELDGIEVCPHHPEYTGACACRKPAPGLLLRAAHRLDLDLARSITVGDAVSDLEAGRRAGTRTVLLRCGHGRAAEAALGAGGIQPDAVFEDLGAAAAWMVAALSDSAEHPAPPPA